MVLGVVDQHCLDVRVGDAQRGEVGAEVGRLVAAAQLDDADALPAAVGAGREVVQLGERRGRERLGRDRAHAQHRLVALEVRIGGGAVVESEHAFDHAREIARHADRAGAAAVAARGVLVLLKLHPERRVHGLRGARQHDAAARGVGFDHREVLRLGEGGDAGQVVRVGAVCGGELLAREVLALARMGVVGRAVGSHRVRDRRLRAQAQRHFDALVGACGPDRLGAFQRVAFAARDGVSAGHDASFATRARRTGVRRSSACRRPASTPNEVKMVVGTRGTGARACGLPPSGIGRKKPGVRPLIPARAGPM